MNELGKKLCDIAFDKQKADYLLAMREESGNVAPVFISKGEDIGEANIDYPYQLVTILSRIYPWLNKGKIAIVARRCDEKALNETIKRGLFDGNRIAVIGLACSKEQIKKCRCNDPVPTKVDIGEPNNGVNTDELMNKLQRISPEERMDFWVRQFKKCNKCFACTTNCPVCFCEDCVLEERTFVAEKGIPPGLSFHMIRTFHLADKCIECGECERSCPVDIPLLTLRKMALKDIKDLYNFKPGDRETASPMLTTLEGELLEDDTHVC
ncbi:MAG: 4Fe-4S dicluster domain-containing protein [Thermoplasmata archaeon]|nr:4Fe-4S dicluster domain-containing protein [Thermoplasmata archaeon]